VKIIKPDEKQHVKLKVNGKYYDVFIKPNKTLLEVLEKDLWLTGARYGCGTGECGACTVLIDGEPVLACLVLALDAVGKEITTIEGLPTGEKLHPVQESFVKHGAIQCGFCTPGFVLMAVALLKENPNASEKEIRDYLIGNLCRCTGYAKIVDAIMALSKKQEGK
jgi:carbon-monoxide dehydrogenase small subunit